MMCINKSRRRSTTASDFLQHFAIGHLREAAASVFLRCRHPEHTNATQAVDHAAWYVCLAVDLRSVKMFVQKFAEFSERVIQLALLRSGNTRIRHHPIGNKMPLEKSLGEPECLRPCKKQFLSVLNFLLSLRVELVHSVRVRKN